MKKIARERTVLIVIGAILFISAQEIFAEPDPEMPLRVQAARALGEMGDASVIPYLQKQIDGDPANGEETEPEVITAIEEVLKKLGVGVNGMTALDSNSGKRRRDRGNPDDGEFHGRKPSGNRDLPTELAQREKMKSEIIEDIAERYHISVDKAFPLQGVMNISAVLNTLFADHSLFMAGLGLKRFEYGPGLGREKFATGYYQYTAGTVTIHYDYSESPLSFSKESAADHTSTVMHEISHAIDYVYFGRQTHRYEGTAFENLYKESFGELGESGYKGLPRETRTETGLSENFAVKYGESNHEEDFATTVQSYFVDAPGQFLRAVRQAKENKPVYLKKLLFVLNVFTAGHPGQAFLYKADGESIKKLKVKVDRDATSKIVAIDGISIEDLAQLENYFQEIHL